MTERYDDALVAMLTKDDDLMQKDAIVPHPLLGIYSVTTKGRTAGRVVIRRRESLVFIQPLIAYNTH